MARHRLPYADERAFEGPAANVLVTGRHRRATCPMQCRAKLIGGREIRPRNPVRPFEKALVSGLCIRKVARKARAISGGGLAASTYSPPQLSRSCWSPGVCIRTA